MACCPACGCTVGYDCECADFGAEFVQEQTKARAVVEDALAYGWAVLSRLAQAPEPAEGARRYAERSLAQLEHMLAVAGQHDRVRGLVENLPRALLR